MHTSVVKTYISTYDLHKPILEMGASKREGRIPTVAVHDSIQAVHNRLPGTSIGGLQRRAHKME